MTLVRQWELKRESSSDEDLQQLHDVHCVPAHRDQKAKGLDNKNNTGFREHRRMWHVWLSKTRAINVKHKIQWQFCDMSSPQWHLSKAELHCSIYQK